MSDWIDDSHQDAGAFGSTTEVHGDLTEVHQPDGSTIVYYDPNHDGEPDQIGYDRDSDGDFERVDADTDQDGHPDTTYYDFDNDGKIDAILPDRGGALDMSFDSGQASSEGLNEAGDSDVNPYLRA
jgi:hypothetical protein